MNAVTGQPVAGATISLAPSPTGPAQQRRPGRIAAQRETPENPSVLSGPDGAFAFSNVAPGKYMLTAYRRGFGQQAYEQHEQFSSAIIVGPGKVSTDIVFRVEPDASLSGSIIDEHNEPVANAQVMLFRDGIQNGKHGIYRDQQVSSTDEGRYRFTHLRPGKYYIAITATPWYTQSGRFRPAVVGREQSDESRSQLDVAFPLTFYPGVTDSASAEAINLKPGERESADFTLNAVPSVHVRVHAAGSDPQQNINAVLLRDVFGTVENGGRNMSFGQGITDIAGITPGRYILQLRLFVPGRGPERLSEREIEVSGDMEVNAAETPGGVNLTGTLRLDGPAPGDRLRLMLLRRNREGFPLDVNAKGEFSTDRPVAPGTYDLVLPVNGYQITQIAATGAKLKGQSIQIDSSDVGLTVVAERSSATVDGIALKDGQPLPGAMIVLVPAAADRPLLYRLDQSDSDGTFHLQSVTPGKYTLVALENGWDMEWARPEVLRPFLAGGEPVQAAVDGEYHVNPKVQPAQPR